MSFGNTPRILIESIDGSGKTTTAIGAAQKLSEAYSSSTIKVVDSNGVYFYRNGNLEGRHMENLANLEPHQNSSKIVKIAKLGAFTVGRRMADSILTGNADLVVSVRDPFRIDPATYSPIYMPSIFKRFTTESRLRLFDKLTWAPHPQEIIHLHADASSVLSNLNERPQKDEQDTPENLQYAVNELGLVIQGYQRLFGSKAVNVEALKPQTIDEVAEHIEPVLHMSLGEKAYADGAKTIAF